MFFVDLEPAAINTDIFNVTSILHTKIKIEEPHKRRDILQCHNCQDYGHSKKYCSYSPRCVRCGDEHPSTHCTKTRDCRPSVPFARVTIPRITKVVKHTKVSNSSVIPPKKKIVTIQIMLIMLITLILKPLISILPILIHHQTLPNLMHRPPPQIILPKHQIVLQMTIHSLTSSTNSNRL